MGGNLQKQLGAWGEALAAEYLKKQGYAIVEHHYVARGGEIDLLVTKGETMAVVEVKLGSGRYYAPGEAVTYHKRKCLKRAMDHYIMNHPGTLQQWNIRFDICQITAPYGLATRYPKIEYFENAFYPP